MKDLLQNIRESDMYFPDRDGQSFLHHIAKDGLMKPFRYMVVHRGCNPLRRDRDGSTAWDLIQLPIRQTEKPQELDTCPDHSRMNEPTDLIQHFVTHAYTETTHRAKLITVAQKDKDDSCFDPERYTTREFFSAWKTGQLAGIEKDVNNETEPVWIQLDVNDVSYHSCTDFCDF
jgi:hypothetical protein